MVLRPWYTWATTPTWLVTMRTEQGGYTKKRQMQQYQPPVEAYDKTLESLVKRHESVLHFLSAARSTVRLLHAGMDSDMRAMQTSYLRNMYERADLYPAERAFCAECYNRLMEELEKM